MIGAWELAHDERIDCLHQEIGEGRGRGGSTCTVVLSFTDHRIHSLLSGR